MDEYLAFKNDARKRISSGALSSITDQINDTQKQIQQQENQLTLFQMSNNIPYLTEHGLSAGSHLSKLVEILSDLRTEVRLLELLTPAQFNGLSEVSEVPIVDTDVPGEKAAHALAINTAAPQSAYYQALQQIDLLKAKRDYFSQVLRPTHSKMVKLNQEIAGLEQLLKTLQDEGENRALTHMVNRKKSLELQIQNLESQYRTWETNAVEASQKLAEYDRMKQDIQRGQALYDRLLGLLQTVDLNNNLDQELLVPMAPASQARPTAAKTGIMAVGFVLAFLVGLGAFLALEFMDDRFTSVSELSLHVPAEVAGQIPKTRLRPSNGFRRLIAADAQPAFAESFRNLRSFLLFMPSTQNAQPKVILITSAIPKEGKTTVASNLARTLAVSGSSVLLVDADLRRGSVHQVFDVCLKPGLREVLSHEVPAAQAIVETAHPGLFVLPAGELGNSNSDAFLRSGMSQLLHDLAAQYSYIVIDSAPVLATDDAACLGPSTDGVFMVVRASYTSARMTREALDRLRKRKVTVLGMVYNCAPPSSDYYWRYSRDYYPARQATGPPASGPAEALSQDAKGSG
jgi:capsular exopolysaccharide synthesis family protein